MNNVNVHFFYENFIIFMNNVNIQFFYEKFIFFFEKINGRKKCRSIEARCDARAKNHETRKTDRERDLVA